MVNVTIDNNIESFVLADDNNENEEGKNEEGLYIVGRGPQQYDKGPMLSEYGTDRGITDFAPSLGTNGYALVKGVGVIDLSDGSLVTGTTFNFTYGEYYSSFQWEDITKITDTGYAVQFHQDLTNDAVQYEYYDVTAASPTVQSGYVSATNVGSIDNSDFYIIDVAFADSTELGFFVHYRNYDGNNWYHNYFFVDLLTDSVTEIPHNTNSTLPTITTGKNNLSIGGVKTPNNEWALAVTHDTYGYLIRHTGTPTPGNFDYKQVYDHPDGWGYSVWHDAAVQFYRSNDPRYYEVEQVNNTTWANDLVAFLNQEDEVSVREDFFDKVSNRDWRYTGEEWFSGYYVFDPNTTQEEVRIYLFNDNGYGIAHHNINGVHHFDDRRLFTLPDVTDLYTSSTERYKLIVSLTRNARLNINGHTIARGDFNNGKSERVETFVKANDVLEVDNNSVHISLTKVN